MLFQLLEAAHLPWLMVTSPKPLLLLSHMLSDPDPSAPLLQGKLVIILDPPR